jgi:hypothetical protein
VRDKIVTIVPLWEFHLDGDVPFRLTRNISIRKLKRKEKADTELHVGFMLGRTSHRSASIERRLPLT